MNKKELRIRNRELIPIGVDLAYSVGHCFVEKELSRLFLGHVVATGGYIDAIDYDLSLPQVEGRLQNALDSLNQASYSLQMLLHAGAVDIQSANEFLVRGKELSVLLVSLLDE